MLRLRRRRGATEVTWRTLSTHVTKSPGGPGEAAMRPGEAGRHGEGGWREAGTCAPSQARGRI
jgi:hypothetical protein